MIPTDSSPLRADEIHQWPALASYVAALSRLAGTEVHCSRGGPASEQQCAAAAWNTSFFHQGESWLVYMTRPPGDGRPAWREPVLLEMMEAMQQNLGNKKPLGEWPQAVRTAWSLVTTHPCRAMSLAEVASCVGLSAGYLGEQFERVTGTSFKRALRDERVAYACGILETTSRRVSEIASNIGGLSLSQFNRCFVAATGMSPSTWRRRYSIRKNARFSPSPPAAQ